MTVTKDSVVGIEYTLTDDKKQTLDSSAGAGPLEYLHGHNNIIPGLEKELDGKSVGDKFPRQSRLLTRTANAWTISLSRLAVHSFPMMWK